MMYISQITRIATNIGKRSPILGLPEQMHSFVVVGLVVDVVVLVVVDAMVLEE